MRNFAGNFVVNSKMYILALSEKVSRNGVTDIPCGCGLNGEVLVLTGFREDLGGIWKDIVPNTGAVVARAEPH